MGHPDKEIAQALRISSQTVESHWKRIRTHYGTSSRTHIVTLALCGLVDDVRREGELLWQSLRPFLDVRSGETVPDSFVEPNWSDAGLDSVPAYVPPGVVRQLSHLLPVTLRFSYEELLRPTPTLQPGDREPVEIEWYRRHNSGQELRVTMVELMQEKARAMEAGRKRGVEYIELVHATGREGIYLSSRFLPAYLGQPAEVVCFGFQADPWFRTVSPDLMPSEPTYW